MKFVLTTGGTAGHINPALALAEELVSRGHSVIFAGTPNRLEAKLVPQAGFEFKSFIAKGFNRKHPFSIIPAINSIISSTKSAKKWLSSIKADAVVGFGCYVSLSICRAAKSLGIPYFIHEQNSVMGMANKYLSKWAKVTCLTYERAKIGRCNNVYVTGNPVRSIIFKSTKSEGRKLLDVPENAQLLLVFGGSLGAQRLNKSITDLADKLLDRKDLYIVHITGSKFFDFVKENINLVPSKVDRYKIFEYQNQMGETLAASDICVTRAGASTLAELCARELPAILVPFPNATEDHQFYNAKTLVDAGCALCIDDKDVVSEKFEKAVFKLIDDKSLREKMKIAYNKFDAPNAVKKLADVVSNL